MNDPRKDALSKQSFVDMMKTGTDRRCVICPDCLTCESRPVPNSTGLELETVLVRSVRALNMQSYLAYQRGHPFAGCVASAMMFSTRTRNYIVKAVATVFADLSGKPSRLTTLGGKVPSG